MKTLTTLLLSLILCAAAGAAQRTLEWDPNPPEDFVTKYVVYEKLAPGWTKLGEATTTEFTLPVAPGTHTYAVTAMNAAEMESERSNELTFTVTLPAPKNLKLKVTQSADLNAAADKWRTVAAFEVPVEPAGRAFYRLAFE